MTITSLPTFQHECDVVGCNCVVASPSQELLPDWTFATFDTARIGGTRYEQSHLLCPNCHKRLCDILRDASFGFAKYT